MGAAGKCSQDVIKLKGRSEQANIHVDTSRGGGIEFVLCGIDTHPACLSSSCTIQEEETMEVKAPQFNTTSEFRLINLLFPDMVHLLEGPCIWMEEMAATVHMTPHSGGMAPISDDKLQGHAITVGNGILEITTMHGTIKGQMVNKNSISVGTAVFNDVAY